MIIAVQISFLHDLMVQEYALFFIRMIIIMKYQEIQNKKERIQPMAEIEKEYYRSRESAGIIDLSEWTKLSIQGPDRKTFLHGLVSNEVKNLHSGQLNFSLFLTPQGRILADFWILDSEEKLLLWGQKSIHDTLLEDLNKYLIMEDALIEDESESQTLILLHGPEAPQKLASLLDKETLPTQNYEHNSISIANAFCIVARIPLFGNPGYFVYCTQKWHVRLIECFRDNGWIQNGSEVQEILRIESGIPLLGKDIEPKTLPQEAHLDSAISYTKGCYIGQEVVARLHFRGHLNRELTGFLLDTDQVPETPLSIRRDKKEIGRITSAVFSPGLNKIIGLGYLRCELREEGRQFKVLTEGNNFVITVHSIPF